ncbi:MAG: acylphosphatase [Bacteroidales bacterium]|nr:acylphosphatase [Bacteroidales bacterium]
MIKHLDILISGNLKNAAIAFLTIKAANQFNIKGIVGYTSNKNIFIEAEGSESQLTKFIDWCKQEKLGAEIKEVVIKNGEIQNYKTFEMEVNKVQWKYEVGMSSGSGSSGTQPAINDNFFINLKILQ